MILRFGPSGCWQEGFGFQQPCMKDSVMEKAHVASAA